MRKHFRLLRRSIATLRSEWEGALPALQIPGTDAAAAIESMSDAGLVRVVDALSAAARSVASLQVLAAGEVARRSRPELGTAGLAKAQGFSSPSALIAQSMGASVADASKLIVVGTATSGRLSFTGERMPSKHPFVDAAVQQGRVSVAAAALVVRMLDRVAARAEAQALADVERTLAEQAAEFSLEHLAILVKRAENGLDPDGVGEREDALHDARYLSLTEKANGAVDIRGALDPLGGAALTTAIDALVRADLLRARDAFGSSRACHCAENTPPEQCTCPDATMAETRTTAQMRADALADIARHAIGCSEAAVGSSNTVVTRMELADLVDSKSVGVATIDGVSQAISAATARCLAASAGIIPLVLGGDSAPLDLGYSQRLFSKSQKLALADRDGGCAHPGCSRPPSFCDAHHIRWWDRDVGPTDIANGILLCTHHHHLLHREGWTITVIDNRTWFTPPVHIDPEQRPRPGNNTRRALPRESMNGLPEMMAA